MSELALSLEFDDLARFIEGCEMRLLFGTIFKKYDLILRGQTPAV